MTARLVGALTVTLTLFVACSGSAYAPPTPLPPQPECRAAGEPTSLCIVILGDSIAAGVPVSDDERWWVRLEAQLQDAMPGRVVAVDNWAVPGSRVDVLESAASDQPGLDSYDMAIVIEGVNDEASSTIEAWARRYEAAIVEMEKRGLIVVVATPPPSFEDGAFMTRYDPTAAAIRDVAGGGRPLLDIARRFHDDGSAVAASYYADLIHLSSEGQRLLAEMAHNVLLQLLGAPQLRSTGSLRGTGDS